ncbi:uncharacterized protein LOC124290065 isoform X1 [Haliotis rubra]|uniref:uncharacterized protein LOC124290065 isoform X1 n=1 Tax=Haliotis rubra TaxID=36100 RepID=UPI001EE519E3|nr:uncharacterized protein LOC124290065 isoform X1 [Haliotis rubra]
MPALRLTVFILLFCGTCGFSRSLFSLFNHCNPPEMLVGKFCAALLDNDLNGNGIVDGSDIATDTMLYNYDEDLCVTNKWEVVTRWSCRYGFSEQYGRYMYQFFDINGDGLATAADLGSVNISDAYFLKVQYTRFKNTYCGDPKNRVTPLDKLQCDEVDKLKPEDIKCT